MIRPGTRTLNVSQLPTGVLDHRAPLWWGNLLLTVIETTVLTLMAAVYFYVHINFTQWPPPKALHSLAVHDPHPGLMIPTISLAVLLLGVIPMIWADRSARARNQAHVQIAIVLCFLFGIAQIALRFMEYPALQFRWDDNAYASVVWTILGMHHMHLFVQTLECSLLATWAFTRPLDEKHALDTIVTASYWYWVAGIWIPLYVIVYWAPRFF